MKGNFSTIIYALLSRPHIYMERGSVRYNNVGKPTPDATINYEIIAPIIDKKLQDLSFDFFSILKNKTQNTNLKYKGLQNYIVIHPSAHSPLKRRNIIHYQDLIIALLKKYNNHILLIGSIDERYITESLQRINEIRIINLYGMITLAELPGILYSAKLYIGNDSRSMHIAAALKIPLIALFGPSVPEVYDLVSAYNHIIHHIRSCNPCNQYDCITPHHTCMNDIKVDQVMSKINLLLSYTDA